MFTILLGAFSGVLLGLTGGGGAIIAVPVLVYGIHLSMKIATTMSLMVVGASALIGVLLRYKEVSWRNGFIFAIIGSISAPLGIKVAQIFSESLLIGCFALLMLIIAVTTFHKSLKSNVKEDHDRTPVKAVKIIPAAILTGFLIGLFGVGGGFIIVPALMILGEMDNKPAVATSLFIISLLSIFSLVNKLAVIKLDFNLTVIFMLGSIAGMFVGSIISKKITNISSQRIFAAVSAGFGIFMMIKSMVV